MKKDIEPKLKLISEYLKLDKTKNFVIPAYQRGYSWDVTQCDKLWQDIEAFMELDASDPYFFGTIIVDCSETNRLSLIDGQQRTTSFFLLLKSLLIRLIEVLNKFENDEETEALKAGLEDNRNKIMSILYKADVEDRIKILKNWDSVKNIVILENISINEQFKNELKTILEAKDFQSAKADVYKAFRKQKDNKYTHYFRNFKYFYDKLLEKQESQLNKFAKIFLEKCQIIEIRSWQLEQAITMFNSLNSTGIPLSDADIISAQLYKNAGNDKTDFKEKWQGINALAENLNSRKIADIDSILQQLMYIIRAKNKEYINISGDGAPDVTVPGLRRYYTEENKELLLNPRKLCEELMKIAEVWDKVKDYPIIKLLFKFNENIKLYLAGYFYRFRFDDITEESILDIAECLLRLFTILELVDSGYSSSKFKTFLFGENVKLVDSAVSSDTIKANFDKHINANWTKGAIQELIIDYDKNILVYLNEYLYAKHKATSFNFSEDVNIEHIMPASGSNKDVIRQNAGLTEDEFKAAVNQLGNKILLEAKINKNLGDSWFRTKKQTSIKNKSGYKDSIYPIAIDLTSYPKDTWKKDDIEETTQKVASRMIDFIFNSKKI